MNSAAFEIHQSILIGCGSGGGGGLMCRLPQRVLALTVGMSIEEPESTVTVYMAHSENGEQVLNLHNELSKSVYFGLFSN